MGRLASRSLRAFCLLSAASSAVLALAVACGDDAVSFPPEDDADADAIVDAPPSGPTAVPTSPDAADVSDAKPAPRCNLDAEWVLEGAPAFDLAPDASARGELVVERTARPGPDGCLFVTRLVGGGGVGDNVFLYCDPGCEGRTCKAPLVDASPAIGLDAGNLDRATHATVDPRDGRVVISARGTTGNAGFELRGFYYDGGTSRGPFERAIAANEANDLEFDPFFDDEGALYFKQRDKADASAIPHVVKTPNYLTTKATALEFEGGDTLDTNFPVVVTGGHVYWSPGGGFDLLRAKETNGKLGAPEVVPSLRPPGTAGLTPAGVSRDGCTLYLGVLGEVTDGGELFGRVWRAHKPAK